MRKIVFGYKNTDGLTNSIEKSAEMIILLNCNGLDLLITRIVDNEDNEINGYIDVCEVIQDFYLNGNFTTYANDRKSVLVKKIEKLLNLKKNQKNLETIDSLVALLVESGLVVKKSKLRPTIGKNGVVLLKFEEFNKYKKYIDDCKYMSMFDMALRIELLENWLDKERKKNIEIQTKGNKK